MMIEIDGSYGEGGGQIIRTSLSLGAISKKGFQIKDIRALRGNPGLQPQHLMACFSASEVCSGKLSGGELLSDEVGFEPGKIVGGEYVFNIGTAGSVVMVAQCLIPILLHAEKKSLLRIIGGTHVMKSPGFDYFNQVFLPAIRKFGAKIKAKMIRPGFYPRGGGEIEISIVPGKLKGNAKWEADKSRAVILLSNLPSHIADREKAVLKENGISDVQLVEESALSPGNALTVWKGFRGSYVLGERGKRAEIVASEAIEILEGENEEVDKHLADQLLLYAALAKGKTSYATSEITEHLRTNAYVISRFLDRKIVIKDKTIVVE